MISPETKIEGIIPVIGLGTWNMNGKECIESVREGLDEGYRHIDTAQNYTNEAEVGKGINQSKINREDIFLTTKVASGNLTPEGISSSFEESLKKLDTSYVDLLLIHWPTSSMDLKACLETMFELANKNKVRYVGVSNFSSDLFKKALEIGPVANNQVKFSPYDTPFEILNTIEEENKTLTAYSPLEQGKVSKNDRFSEVGEKYNKTASQTALRWLIQLGSISVIPKASNKEHRKENLEIFDFEISADDMNTLNDFARGKK
jgi:diketogulonate reductase-like aldo/keto reductase